MNRRLRSFGLRRTKIALGEGEIVDRERREQYIGQRDRAVLKVKNYIIADLLGKFEGVDKTGYTVACDIQLIVSGVKSDNPVSPVTSLLQKDIIEPARKDQVIAPAAVD